MKYSVITFGCRVNQADSIEIEAQLLATGGVAVEPDDADLVVVNTCSVTSASPCLSAGTFPIGLIARYSGRRCSPAFMLRTRSS